ncbi:MAG: hypothetical protein JXJ17_19540 [Anaerolineae bacterium]|nr:hypothetical protein [Anaerolineae bacterium]
MKRSHLLIVTAVLIAALVGCRAESAATPTATEIAATSTSTAAPTDTPVPTPTIIPSPTPMPTGNPYAGPVPEGALMRLGKGSINEFALSPNGDYLAIASSIGVFVYWLDTLAQVWYGSTESSTVSVAWSPDGTRLASGVWDLESRFGSVILWNVADGQRIRTLEGCADPVFGGVVWSPDGTRLASADCDTAITVWTASKLLSTESR